MSQEGVDIKEIFELNEQAILDCMGEAHLGDVDTLLLRNKGLHSLEKLSQFNLPNLAAVLVSNNSLGPGLGGLESIAYSLTSLNINNNAVEDVSALRSCTALESLFASCNRIRGAHQKANYPPNETTSQRYRSI